MSTLSSANVTDVNLVLKERTHMRLCINMLIFTHNLGNWLIKLLTAAMQQFALNALLHELLHAADVSLQNLAASTKWLWFGSC